MNRRCRFSAACILTVFLALVLAAGPMPVALAADKMEVAVNQSRVVSYYGVERVAVANPDIADVLVVSGEEILLVGKAPGMTTLHIWASGGRATYVVEVAANDAPIANDIKKILGYNDIRVSKIGKTIILEGKVNDQYQKTRAASVAGAYAEKVVNLLEITSPVQVKIEAQVIEINREKIRDMGIQWGSVNPFGNTWSPNGAWFGQGLANGMTANNMLGKLGTNNPIMGIISGLIKNGSAQILSQPNIITVSGDKANIMVGGEIPVPVSAENGRIGIEWKPYGIKLEIAPEVNSEGLINSKIKAEVSAIDWNSTHVIKLGPEIEIPPLTMRKAETAIALASGQTMAIGGLVARENSRDISKLPILGNLPVIGKLFQSTSFNRGETELIILITPTVVTAADYHPARTQEMDAFMKENPWGGKSDGGKNTGTDR